jgi:hypothetical protein
MPVQTGRPSRPKSGWLEVFHLVMQAKASQCPSQPCTAKFQLPGSIMRIIFSFRDNLCLVAKKEYDLLLWIIS